MYMCEGSVKDLLIMQFLVTSSSFANACHEATVSLTSPFSISKYFCLHSDQKNIKDKEMGWSGIRIAFVLYKKLLSTLTHLFGCSLLTKLPAVS